MRAIDKLHQKPPFLFVDSIVEQEDYRIITSKTFSGREDFFKGHFPDLPIVPGVILCECAFQTSSLLMMGKGPEGHGVVTKIDFCRFKELVRPNQELIIDTKILDSLENQFKFSTKIVCEKNIVLKIIHSCALISSAKIQGH